MSEKLKPTQEEIGIEKSQGKIDKMKFEMPQVGKEYFKNYLKENYENYYLQTDLVKSQRNIDHLDGIGYKYNTNLRKFLFDLFSSQAEIAVSKKPEADKKAEFKEAAEKFFEPLAKKKENKVLLIKYNSEKTNLSRELERINQNNFISKEEKTKRKGPVEQKLLELSRLRKKPEKQMKITDSGVLLQFVPGYWTDLYKTFPDGMQSPENLQEFNKKWEIEKLDKNLGKLFEDLDKSF
jgi:hypothetical protein